MTAMLLHDAAADRESESGAAHGARVRCVDLLEALEDLLQLVCRNAATVIFNLDQRLVRCDVVRDQANLAGNRRSLR